MKFVNMFLLHLQRVFEQRFRSFIWLLVVLSTPLMSLLFLKGSITKEKMDISNLNSYYFLVVITSAILISHIEEEVAEFDIKRGKIVKYLIKPISYFWSKFIEEIPYRFLQGFFGIIVFIGAITIFHLPVVITNSPEKIVLSVTLCILAFFLSFTLRMNSGLVAFWITDAYGLFEILEVILVLCAGIIAPLYFYPAFLEKIIYLLPFAYMIYFPVRSLQGLIPFNDYISIFAMQGLWLLVLSLLYRFLWKKGSRKYSGEGE